MSEPRTRSGTGGPRLTAEQLVERLDGEIVGRLLPAGTKLPSERELAARYGLSRPAVREVLRRLQERNLIDIFPARGSFVRELQATKGTASVELMSRRGHITARDLARARQMLESESAALAAEHRADAEVTQMRGLLEALDDATDVAVAAELDLAFHEAIAVASGNVVLQIMFGSIRNLTHGIMLRSLTDRSVRKVGAPLHHSILDAIAERNPEAARREMFEHLRLAESYYGADLNQPLADVLRRRAARHPDIADVLRDVTTSFEEPPG
jgi:GntR family transcriptional repressor for pyruvate dehydrogenase complex